MLREIKSDKINNGQKYKDLIKETLTLSILKLMANLVASNHSSSPEMMINEDGDKKWYLNSNLHREDGPAIEYADGTKEWRINGLIHRKDGPAVEFMNGDRLWYINGKAHREDGPAIEHANGDIFWYLNDDWVEYDPETWDQIVKESKIENIMKN